MQWPGLKASNLLNVLLVWSIFPRDTTHSTMHITGFKYIGNTALDLVKEGYEVCAPFKEHNYTASRFQQVPFAYEEAIGFMIKDEIRDKDGIAAMVPTTLMCVEDKGHYCRRRSSSQN